ncbi:nitroreductase [Acidovorax sp. MR-S7]|uniref:nitroreductase n=1 Tax=Acidovorax sp. MR-S7 TaxID=1268622 RepID=UPI000363DC98|nr:nitroreductase [Acidovorax sp. MR-S7]GAD21950.1 nitroreductase [Acidovorax sp. MR-S7]
MTPTAHDLLARERHSVRAFLPRAVPAELLEHLLAVARRAPSGANLQPGRFWAVEGAARERLCSALAQARRDGVPEQEDYGYFPRPMPLALRKRQVAAAQALYGAIGVARGDEAGRAAQFERNFRFFDAPVALVVTIDRDFGAGGFMDLGMCLHALMLAAQGHGLAGCAIGALASYPAVVRSALGLAESEVVVCGMALGWEDTQAPVNSTRTAREPLERYFAVLR